jgi:hypothetical protein
MAVDIIGVNAPKDGPYLTSAASGTLTNETVISTSAQLAAIISDETGSGSLVFATSPTLVTPALGTPSALVGTNITGTAAGLTAGNVTTNANLTGEITSVGNAASLGSFTSAALATALSDETGSGAAVFATSPTLVTPAIGTPSSGTLTNCTGLPITGITSSTSAQLATLISDETGSGSLVFATSPTLVTPAIGTPSSGTLTNCTGLPLTGLVDDTSTAVGVGSIELGNATDTTLSRSAAGILAVEGVVIPSISSTNTLTNKRITERVTTIVSSATPTINTDDCDAVTITALAADITSMTTNLSGTETNFQKLTFRILDNGTGRAITWGAAFEPRGVALPTTTTASKLLTVGFIYDTVDAIWGCVASVEEA